MASDSSCPGARIGSRVVESHLWTFWGILFPLGLEWLGMTAFSALILLFTLRETGIFLLSKEKKKRGSEINFFFLKNVVTEPWHNPFWPLNTLCQQWERTPQLSHFMPNVPGVRADRGREDIDHKFYLLWILSSVGDATCYESCIPEKQCVKDTWLPWFLCKVGKYKCILSQLELSLVQPEIDSSPIFYCCPEKTYGKMPNFVLESQGLNALDSCIIWLLLIGFLIDLLHSTAANQNIRVFLPLKAPCNAFKVDLWEVFLSRQSQATSQLNTDSHFDLWTCWAVFGSLPPNIWRSY